MDIIEVGDYCRFKIKTPGALDAILNTLNGDHPTIRDPEVLLKTFRIDNVKWKKIHDLDNMEEKFYHLQGTADDEWYQQCWFEKVNSSEFTAA